MRISSAVVVLTVTLTACTEQPVVGGKAHPRSVGVVVGQAVDGDPHAVQREVTVSSYCLTCHPIDLASSHPVGVSLAAAAAADPVNYTFPPTAPAVVMVNGECVECSSCHDDGSAGYPFKTVVGNGLCETCHTKSDASPTVVVTSPVDGATVQGTVSVQGTATDDVGVVRAELRLGPAGPSQTLVSSQSCQGTYVPISLPFDTTTQPNGSALLEVRVYDTIGNFVGTTITVTISNPLPDTVNPSVTITAPATGAYVRGSVPVDVTATDNVGVERLELWVGSSVDTANTLAGSIVPTGSTETFLLDTAAFADGTIVGVVKAYDAAGNVGSAVRVVINDNTPPSVAIASPADGANVRGLTTITANATDIYMSGVDFYVDGALAGSSATAPYSTTWDFVRKSGTHTITAVATDRAGNVATSPTVTVQAR